MKRVIVTGASGFVGANLTRRLLGDGHELYLLMRQGFSPWRIKSIEKQVYLREVNLIDAEATDRIVKEIKPDWIFHLATHGAYSTQNKLPSIIDTNIVGTINLLEACLKTGFEAFVNTGSSSEYGFKDHPPAETEPIEPNSYYAFAKASATLFCRFTAQRHGLNIPTLRLYSVFGPYEEPSRLMPTLIMHGLQGKLPSLVNPDIARDFIYTEDVNEAFLRAATKTQQEPGAIYNVGSGIQTTLREVVEIARRLMNITVEPQWGSMPDRAWDTSVWVSDNRKIRHDLSWEPRYSFEEGFKIMVDWVASNSNLYLDSNASSFKK